MPSTFAFYRLYGVRGNYIVEITLVLVPPEKARVVASLRRADAVEMKPSRKEGNTEIYEIGKDSVLIPGDWIIIEVSKKPLCPVQMLTYTATGDGFTRYAHPFTANNHTWQPNQIEYQKIALIDWGSQKPPVVREALTTPPAQPVLNGFLPLAEALRQINPAEYPHLSLKNIEDMIKQWQLPDGTVDMNKVHKTFQKSKRKAREKQAISIGPQIIGEQQREEREEKTPLVVLFQERLMEERIERLM